MRLTIVVVQTRINPTLSWWGRIAGKTAVAGVARRSVNASKPCKMAHSVCYYMRLADS